MYIHNNKAHLGVVIHSEDTIGFDWLENLAELGLNTLAFHNMVDLDQDFINKAAALGIDLEFELHIGKELLPRSLFSSNPDYFAFDRNLGRTPSYNFCPSSPTSMQLVCDNARRLVEKYPSTSNRYFFWGDDGVGWCHCPKCCNISYSDQQLMVVNRIAGALRKDNPDAMVSYLAYRQMLQTPVQIKPAPGVFLEYAPWLDLPPRCLRHCLNSRECEVNRYIWEQLPPLLEVFPVETAQVIDYWLDVSIFNRADERKPANELYFDAEVMRQDIAAYRSLGIRNITTFAVGFNQYYLKNYSRAPLDIYGEILSGRPQNRTGLESKPVPTFSQQSLTATL